ncbi:hypothetical protein [Trichocoleus sp. FACHB-262]|uniref:hypothetical protein n=1 Tax=Trichocoleus sp. FACHB-262 TaxID=2692869 RepID=UPI001687AE8D|nr:hypothetical protein [Trichocoleus sp. FACHB-262]MBD2119961.1 hypothetical protein [Trichocoleus sp. FACHB-262]
MPGIFLKLGKALLKQVLVLGLITLISLGGSLAFLQQPSYASASTSNTLTPEEKIDRAYSIRAGTGIREEEYQRRQQEGQDPTKMKDPYTREIKPDQEAVPETSGLEKKIDRTRNLVSKVTGQK